MPYIKQEDRKALDAGDTPQTAGELNYCFSKIADQYLQGGFNYQRINDIVGALDGAKMELYRRLAAPYEDTKIVENGDVYSERNAVLQPQAEERAAAA